MNSLFDKVITIGGTSPRQVAKTVLILLLFSYATGRISQSIFRHGIKRTIMYIGFLVWKQYKGDSGYREEMTNVKRSFQTSLYLDAVKKTSINRTIPTKSISFTEILSNLKKMEFI